MQRVNLDFVEARLGVVAGRQDGQADHPGRHRLEPLDVAPRVDHGTDRSIPIGPGQRLVGIEALFDLGQLGRDRGRLALTVLGIGRGQLALGVVDPREDRLKAVIVLLRDRVELVVVAPRALDRQAQECGAGRRDHIIEIVGPLLEHPLDRLVADDVVRPADQEPGRRLGEPVGRCRHRRPVARGRTGETACRG